MIWLNWLIVIPGWEWFIPRDKLWFPDGTIGWPAQNCADTDGYVDVRTGKKYSLQGENDSFFKEIKWNRGIYIILLTTYDYVEWIHFRKSTRNTTKSSNTPPMRSLDGSYPGFSFLSCFPLWSATTAKSAVYHWTTGLVGSRWLQ